jgi:hypothetical protein
MRPSGTSISWPLSRVSSGSAMTSPRRSFCHAGRLDALGLAVDQNCGAGAGPFCADAKFGDRHVSVEGLERCGGQLRRRQQQAGDSQNRKDSHQEILVRA